MESAGVVDEVRRFLARDDVSAEAAQALGLAEIREHIEGRLSLEVALARVAALTIRFAKRQATFFKHFPSATWWEAAPDAPPDAIAADVAALYARGAAPTSA